MQVAFPKVLLDWLATLPAADRTRETLIAERNLQRITLFLRGE